MKLKNYILYIVFLLGVNNVCFAQITIGKNGQRVTNESVLLEFGADDKGIILPQVNTVPASVGGTFIFNAVSRVVEVWEGRNNSVGGWTELSKNNNVTPAGVGLVHDFYNKSPESPSSGGVIIGADSTTKQGVLVLESTTKAMVLPKVANPQTTIVGAIAGTMVYDSASDMLSVFDGLNWSYWK